MKPKTMILMGLAITCGLGASYMTSRLLAERQTPDAPETVDILVAKYNISVHTKIAKPEEMFEVKTVAKADEPPDAIRDLESLRNKKLRTGRNKGDHITASNLYDKDGGLEIPEGLQGIGVRVNVETTASGLASLPGKRVDLQLTVRAQDPNATKVLVLLQNVLVLAADIETTSEGRIASPAQIVTFGLTRSEVLRVNAAMDLGIIRMIIRDPNDPSVAKKDELEVTGAEILNKKKKEEPVIVAKTIEPPVEVKKPEVKPDPPVVVPEAPKWIRGYYEVVNGADAGQRTVDKVFYYRHVETGRIVPDDSPEIQEAQQGAQPNSQSAPKKSTVQKGDV